MVKELISISEIINHCIKGTAECLETVCASQVYKRFLSLGPQSPVCLQRERRRRNRRVGWKKAPEARWMRSRTFRPAYMVGLPTFGSLAAGLIAKYRVDTRWKICRQSPICL